MNWDDYRFVLAIGRKSNLTQAADVLGVNQTTVSRRLKALQQQLGTEVFRKLKQGLVLTEEGQKIFALAEELEQRILSVETSIQEGDRVLSGPLHVSFSEIIGNRWHWAFDAFADKYPHIDLVLSLTNVKVSVMQREADVVIRFTNRPPENLVGRKIARVEYALYCNKTLRGSVANKGDFNQYPWIAWATYCEAKMIEKWMRQHAGKANIAYHVDALALMLEAIGRGDGIGFLPCVYGDADERLVRLRDVEPGFGQDIWILTHPDRRYVRRVQVFMQEFTRIFEEKRLQFSGEAID